MSYKIANREVTSFVDDTTIKLPRFQRKSTWNHIQNFELAISVFQEYPVGVVIINESEGTSWLLDGRQRRTALSLLRSNPDLVYDWAMKYIGFKQNDSELEVTSKFWGKVNQYLQKEDYSTEENEGSNNDDSNEDVDQVSEYVSSTDEQADIDFHRQKAGLKVLLNTILMVHQKKGGLGEWARVFDFKKYVMSPPYAPKSEGNKINPVKLRDTLLKYNKEYPKHDLDNFLKFWDDNGGIRSDELEKEFRFHIESLWDKIVNAIKNVVDAEKIYNRSEIAVITLQNVTPLDQQIIFSRINSGGTQLKAEELLSAKPFWNTVVTNPDNKMLKYVTNLYKKLDVEIPEDGKVVRWDYGATLLSRINDDGLFFNKYDDDSTKVDMTQITLGFKLMSSFFADGMSAISVTDLENPKRNIRWGSSIDELVDDVNTICKLLQNDKFFRYLRSWNGTIYKLMGNAVVLEFVTILLKDWIEKKRPTTSSAILNEFLRDSHTLFDKLVYEYATGMWSGSGDSKMSNHIKNWKERLNPISKEDWAILINGACDGKLNGREFRPKHLIPLTYYFNVIRQCSAPTSELDVKFDIDHIMPKAKIQNNKNIPAWYENALFNIALLPKKDNIAKKDKTLAEITDDWLKQVITTYENIPQDKFAEFSDISNIEQLKQFRQQILQEAFGSKRLSMLSNV